MDDPVHAGAATRIPARSGAPSVKHARATTTGSTPRSPSHDDIRSASLTLLLEINGLERHNVYVARVYVAWLCIKSRQAQPFRSTWLASCLLHSVVNLISCRSAGGAAAPVAARHRTAATQGSAGHARRRSAGARWQDSRQDHARGATGHAEQLIYCRTSSLRTDVVTQSPSCCHPSYPPLVPWSPSRSAACDPMPRASSTLSSPSE